jgi:hypothetical protein
MYVRTVQNISWHRNVNSQSLTLFSLLETAKTVCFSRTPGPVSHDGFPLSMRDQLTEENYEFWATKISLVRAGIARTDWWIMRRDQISSFREKDQSIRIGKGVISVAWSKALCSHRLVRATISCSKYIDHSFEMSLKGGKKRVKRMFLLLVVPLGKFWPASPFQ